MPIQVRRIKYLLLLPAALSIAASLLQGCTLVSDGRELAKEQQENQELLDNLSKFSPSEANGSSSTVRPSNSTAPSAPSGPPSTGVGGIPL